MAVATFLPLRRRGLVCLRLCSSQISPVLSRSQDAPTLDQVTASTESEAELSSPAEIPMVPKRRDPDAVLKALSSTVEPLEREMFRGIGPADPLYPHKHIMKMEFLNHLEAGRKAARYVKYRWPKMFQFKQMDKNPVQFEKKPLQRNIAQRRSHKALWIYNRMRENGEEVSVDTQNSLLALVAYYGLGSKWATKKDAAEIMHGFADLSWWSGGEKRKPKQAKEQSLSDESLGEKLSLEKIEGGVKIWRHDNAAEKLFKDIEDKNGDTYEALIQGLVKHHNVKRAFEVFDEMRQEGFQAHTQTYKLLLSALLGREDEAWPKVMDVLKEMTRGETAAQPDTGLFNVLLQLANESANPLETTRRVMREMFHAGVKPSLTTFYWLNKIYSDRGGHVLGEMLDYLEKNREVLQIQDLECYKFFNEAMTTCRLVGTATEAVRLQRLLESSGNRDFIDNIVYYVSYLLTLTHESENFDLLLSEYKKIVPLRFIPFHWVYGMLFTAAHRARKYDFLVELWEDMVKFGVEIKKVEPIERFCAGLWDFKASSEEAEKCMKLVEAGVKQLQINNMKPTSAIANTLIKMACQIPDIDKAWEYYGWLEATKTNAPYGVLVNMLEAHMKMATEFPDRDPVIRILELLVKRRKYLPSRRFAVEVYDRFNFSEEMRERFDMAFSENKKLTVQNF